MMTPLRVLVVDDDRSVREAIVEFLNANGMVAVSAVDGGDADRLLSTETFEAVVLDVMLPGEDGLSICRRLATAGPPIVMVSAMGSTIDRIVGLELGAADYLAKPFEPRELLARIRSVIRQRSRPAASKPAPHFAFDGLHYDPHSRSLSDAAGAPVSLTAGELRLLDAFVRRPGRLLDRATLLDLTHEVATEPFDRAVDLAVSRLRRRLRDAGVEEPIETVRGVGYRFIAKVISA